MGMANEFHASGSLPIVDGWPNPLHRLPNRYNFHKPAKKLSFDNLSSDRFLIKVNAAIQVWGKTSSYDRILDSRISLLYGDHHVRAGAMDRLRRQQFFEQKHAYSSREETRTLLVHHDFANNCLVHGFNCIHSLAKMIFIEKVS